MSSSPKVKYQPLVQWTTSDEDDEEYGDDVLYDSRLVKGPMMARKDVFELDLLGRSRSKYSVTQKNKSHYKICALVSVLAIVVLSVLGAVLFPIIKHMYSHGEVIGIPTRFPAQDWKKVFNDSWTEAHLRHVDIDGNGIADLLVAIANQERMESLLHKPEDMSFKDLCIAKGMNYPCGGSLIALRGFDGHELWRVSTRSVVIDHNCLGVDVDSDGIEDCIVTGRHSTCQAVDRKTGQVLWVVDPEAASWSAHFVAKWTIYQAVSVPDVDGDMVPDLVVTHGHGRVITTVPGDDGGVAGRVIILSGKTGLPVGAHFLEIPGHQDTQMPAVKYESHSGAVYILFGSGGETTPGNLMAIALPDLYMAVTGGNMMSNVDLTKYTWLKGKNDEGIAILFSDKSQGVLVPPVLVDVDNDGHTDILVSTFSGSVSLLDGFSLQPRWYHSLDAIETFSPPCPGMFNDDDFVDFLIHVNKGEEDTYNSSQTIVFSGLDGSLLWSFDGGSFSHSSDLSVHTSAKNQDAFLITIIGRNASEATLKQMVNADYQKRHLILEEFSSSEVLKSNLTDDEFQLMCDVAADQVRIDGSGLLALTEEVLLLDRQTIENPLLVLEQKPLKHCYQIPYRAGSQHCHKVSDQSNDKIDLCTVLLPKTFTGSVADLNGDGVLEYAHITQMTGDLRSDTFDVTGSISKVIVSKQNLKSPLGTEKLVTLNSRARLDSNLFIDSLQHFKSLSFLPSLSQRWSEYLGSKGNNLYNDPP